MGKGRGLRYASSLQIPLVLKEEEPGQPVPCTTCLTFKIYELLNLCVQARAVCVGGDHRAKNGTWKGTSGGEVISFSGCDDDQTSADTAALSKVASTGAMTYAFIEAIERGHGATYGSILTAMRATINEYLSKIIAGDTNANAGGVRLHLEDVLIMLLSGQQSSQTMEIQEPQLTANEPFDVFAKPFTNAHFIHHSTTATGFFPFTTIYSNSKITITENCTTSTLGKHHSNIIRIHKDCC